MKNALIMTKKSGLPPKCIKLTLLLIIVYAPCFFTAILPKDFGISAFATTPEYEIIPVITEYNSTRNLATPRRDSLLEACTDSSPGRYYVGNNTYIEYSDPRAGNCANTTTDGLGYGGCDCFYTVSRYYGSSLTPYSVDPDWLGQNWAYGFRTCPEGYSAITSDLCQANLPTILEPNKKDLGQSCDTESSFGNPCNASIGNKYQKEIDYTANNTGLSIVRNYNSGLSSVNKGLGFGWTHQGTTQLEITASTITLRQADGRGESFSLVNSLWQADADSHFTLTQDVSGYTLQSDQGSSERYALAGQLTSQTDLVGKQTLYTYNSNGFIETVTAPYGHTLSYAYNSNNLLETISTPENQVYRYQYDSLSNLAQVIYADNTSRLYHYENSSYPHALTGITDENQGRYATFAYHTDGKAILTQHAQTDNGAPQEKFDLSYDSDTQTTVTDAIGTVEILTFNENLGVKNLLSRINQVDQKGIIHDYDANNNLISRTDPEGKITTYSYNATNQKISQIEAAGTAFARLTEYAYLSNHVDLITEIRSPSIIANQQRILQTQYNADQTVKSITLNGYQTDATAITRSTQFQYNSAGQVTEIDGPLSTINDITTLSYYECTTGGQCGQLASISNALNQITHYDNYDNDGRVTQITSPQQIVTTYNYDSRGRLGSYTQTATQDPASTEPPETPRTTQYHYDNAGQLISLTTADGMILNYVYDAAHDLRSITDNLGNKIEYGYDLKGNRVEENIKDPNGILVKTKQISYDHRNHVQTINNGGSITQLIHDAANNLVSETDPNLNPATMHQYDPLHRLQQTLDALSNSTQYQYNSQDQLTHVQAPNGVITNYEYDDFGQRLKEISADRGVTSYQYDAAGNRLSRTDANNITANFQYDALNRITAIDYPGTDLDINYSYDQCNNGIGRLCTISDSHSQTSYQYDPWGNRTEIVNTISNIPHTTQYSYDAGNNLLSTTYPSGTKIDYQRDAIRQITQVTYTTSTANIEPIASQINYLPQGARQSMTFGNGLQEQRSHDQSYRLTGQVTPGLQDRQYLYDAAGNILTINQGEGIISQALEDPETVSGTNTSDISEVDESLDESSSEQSSASALIASQYQYQYDVLHRITEEIASYGQRNYSYDENGNRLTLNKVDQIYNQQQMPFKTVTSNQSYHYPNDSQQLSNISTDKNGANAILDFNYDAVGNTLDKANKHFGYDARNRINSYTENGSLVATYHYNAQGQRIEKIKHGITKTLHYHYDQTGQLLSITRYGNSGVLQAHKDFIWLDNTPIAQITTQYNTNGTEKDRQLVYLHTDHLNTPRIATNVSQTIVWNWDSDAFGLGDANEDPDKDHKKTSVPLRFPGQIASEGGVFYNYHRYYDPSIGRYITSDPIGLDGGINTYGYVSQNPLRFIDPYGMFPTRQTVCGSLRFLVVLFCKDKTQCLGTDSCDELNLKAQKKQKCLEFQILLTNTCFSDDPTHKIRITEMENGIRDCSRKWIAKGCGQCR